MKKRILFMGLANVYDLNLFLDDFLVGRSLILEIVFTRLTAEEAVGQGSPLYDFFRHSTDNKNPGFITQNAKKGPIQFGSALF